MYNNYYLFYNVKVLSKTFLYCYCYKAQSSLTWSEAQPNAEGRVFPGEDRALDWLGSRPGEQGARGENLNSPMLFGQGFLKAKIEGQGSGVTAKLIGWFLRKPQ